MRALYCVNSGRCGWGFATRESLMDHQAHEDGVVGSAQHRRRWGYRIESHDAKDRVRFNAIFPSRI